MSRAQTIVASSGRLISARRVWAMMLRYLYLFSASWPRVVEIAYWPIVQVIMWGFITQFFLTHSSWLVQASGALLSGVLLWDVLFRGQLGVSMSFLEELWSRNLGQLFVSPLHPVELVLAMISMSFVRTAIGLFPAALLAIPLYHFSIFDMGLPLLSFFANLLVFGWAIGLAVSALLMRFGLGAESLAWVGIFAFAPLSAIYYPVAVLPDWLQPVALALPSAHVFEGMRAILIDGVFRFDFFIAAVVLNLLYLGIGSGLFLYSFRVARIRGLLLQVGE